MRRMLCSLGRRVATAKVAASAVHAPGSHQAWRYRDDRRCSDMTEIVRARGAEPKRFHTRAICSRPCRALPTKPDGHLRLRAWDGFRPSPKPLREAPVLDMLQGQPCATREVFAHARRTRGVRASRRSRIVVGGGPVIRRFFVHGDQMCRSQVQHDEGQVATREATDGFGQNKYLGDHGESSTVTC